MAVRGFISPVQAFDHLLEWPVFGRNSIVVGKSNDLGDFKCKVSAQLFTNSIAARGYALYPSAMNLKFSGSFVSSGMPYALRGYRSLRRGYQTPDSR